MVSKKNGAVNTQDQAFVRLIEGARSTGDVLIAVEFKKQVIGLWEDSEIEPNGDEGLTAEERALEALERYPGMTGIAVLAENLVVIDIDNKLVEKVDGKDVYKPVTTGEESFQRFLYDLSQATGKDFSDLEDLSGYIVDSGFGHGSRHIYFRKPAGWSGELRTKWERKYPNIDFLSTRRLIVGEGSFYRGESGARYVLRDQEKTLADIPEAPPELLAYLSKGKAGSTPRKKAASTTTKGGKVRDNNLVYVGTFSGNLYLLEEALGYVTYESRDEWVKILAALKGATGGSAEGFAIAHRWSRGDEENPKPGYIDEKDVRMNWNTISRWTGYKGGETYIFSRAQRAGWRNPGEKEFNKMDGVDLTTTLHDECEDLSDLVRSTDLLDAPGRLGDLITYLHTTSFRPIAGLAVGTAAWALGACYGQNHKAHKREVPFNFLFMAVAPMGQGKSNYRTKAETLVKLSGQGDRIFGEIKSEQYLYRNLQEDRVSIYSIDELSQLFDKIGTSATAQTYHIGTMAALLELTSSETTSLSIPGDTHREVKSALEREIQSLQKLYDRLIKRKDGGGESGFVHAFSGMLKEVGASDLVPVVTIPQIIDRMEEIRKELLLLQEGIEDPFFHLLGLTTTASEKAIFNKKNIRNGLLSRAVIYRETRSISIANPLAEKEPRFPDHIVEHVRDSAKGNHEVRYTEKALNVLHQVRVWSASSLREHVAEIDPTQDLEYLVDRIYDQIEAFAFIAGASDEKIVDLDHVVWAISAALHFQDMKLRAMLPTITRRTRKTVETRANAEAPDIGKLVDAVLEGVGKEDARSIASIVSYSRDLRGLEALEKKGELPVGSTRETMTKYLEEQVEKGAIIKIKGEGRKVDTFYSAA